MEADRCRQRTFDRQGACPGPSRPPSRTIHAGTFRWQFILFLLCVRHNPRLITGIASYPGKITTTLEPFLSGNRTKRSHGQKSDGKKGASSLSRWLTPIGGQGREIARQSLRYRRKCGMDNPEGNHYQDMQQAPDRNCTEGRFSGQVRT